MALRTIRVEGDPVLTKVSRPVDKMTPRNHELIMDMLDTMYDAMGVGLAAPQVGILKRIVVIDVGEGPIVLINPQIIESSGEQTGEEGCLSVPGKFGIVTRPDRVKVRAFDENMNEFEMEGEGLLARAFLRSRQCRVRAKRGKGQKPRKCQRQHNDYAHADLGNKGQLALRAFGFVASQKAVAVAAAHNAAEPLGGTLLLHNRPDKYAAVYNKQARQNYCHDLHSRHIHYLPNISRLILAHRALKCKHFFTFAACMPYSVLFCRRAAGMP